MEFLEVSKAVAELTTTTVIIGAVVYLLVKYFLMIIDRKEDKTCTNADNFHSIDLGSLSILKERHPYFNKIDSIINIKLPITKIGGPVRTMIFRDMLRIFYETGKELNYKLLDEPLTKDNFLPLNLKYLNLIVTIADERMEEYGVPLVVREKFWEWNYRRHEYIMATLSDIDSSTVFESIIEKQSSVLNLYQSSSYFVLMDAEQTLKSLNGDLSGQEYKGQIIEGLHDN